MYSSSMSLFAAPSCGANGQLAALLFNQNYSNYTQIETSLTTLTIDVDGHHNEPTALSSPASSWPSSCGDSGFASSTSPVECITIEDDEEDERPQELSFLDLSGLSLESGSSTSSVECITIEDDEEDEEEKQPQDRSFLDLSGLSFDLNPSAYNRIDSSDLLTPYEQAIYSVDNDGQLLKSFNEGQSKVKFKVPDAVSSVMQPPPKQMDILLQAIELSEIPRHLPPPSPRPEMFASMTAPARSSTSSCQVSAPMDTSLPSGPGSQSQNVQHQLQLTQYPQCEITGLGYYNHQDYQAQMQVCQQVQRAHPYRQKQHQQTHQTFPFLSSSTAHVSQPLAHRQQSSLAAHPAAVPSAFQSTCHQVYQQRQQQIIMQAHWHQFNTRIAQRPKH